MNCSMVTSIYSFSYYIQRPSFLGSLKMVTTIFSSSFNVFKKLFSVRIVESLNSVEQSLIHTQKKMSCNLFVTCRKVLMSQKFVHLMLHLIILSSIYTHFNTLKKKNLRKTLWKKVKLLIISKFNFFPQCFQCNL